MVAWTYLPADARGVFRRALAIDDATWSRARGWALNLGLRAAAWAAGNSVLAAIGRNTVAAVVADAAAGRLR
jgi:aminoglycoside phosphotransferase (APT) family kinase protein